MRKARLMDGSTVIIETFVDDSLKEFHFNGKNYIETKDTSMGMRVFRVKLK